MSSCPTGQANVATIPVKHGNHGPPQPPVCPHLLRCSCSNSTANQPGGCRPATFCRIPILYKQFTWKPNITFSLSLPSSLCRVLLHKPEESTVRRGWYVVGNCPSGLSPGGSVSLQLSLEYEMLAVQCVFGFVP